MLKLAEILDLLAQPVPSEMLAEKLLQGNKITYIPWYNLADLLDERAPGWEFHVDTQSAHPHYWDKPVKKNGRIVMKDGKPVTEKKSGLFVACKGSITIHGSDRSLTREALGYESPEDAHIGDSLTNAEANTLRRACGKLGLGRDLWRKKVPAFRNNNSQQSRQTPQQQSRPAQQKQEPQLTPEQMVSMVRTMLDNSYQQGGEALKKAISTANKKLSKFPADKRPEVQEMIKGYSARMVEFQVG